MQVKQLKQEGLNHELEVVITAEDIGARVEKRLKEVSRTVKLPGFRPGKVPMEMMKKKYGKAVMGDVLESTVNETSVKAMQDNDIRPAMQPKIEVTSFDEGKDLIYTLSVEVLPKFEIGSYKGFELTKLVAKADEAAIDEALKNLASMRKSSEVITEKRATKTGDIVVIDFDGRTADDNKARDGMRSQGFNLELGSGQFIPGFEDQLTGKKAGDKVEVKVTFPENYGAAELAGRDAIFDVEIHEIREPKAPEINDEFAKAFGMEDVAALRKAIAEEVERELSVHGRLKLKKSVLDVLDDLHDFDIPQGMKDMELKNILNQVNMDSQRRGVESNLSDEENEELEAIAERRVRLGLILSEIGNQNKIRVADIELQRAVIAEAQKYPGQEKQVFDFYAKNRQALESLRAPLFEDKVIDFILELATVTEKEVSAEELKSEDDIEIKPKKKSASKPVKAEGEKKAKSKKAE